MSRAGRLAWAIWVVALAAAVCGLVFLWLSRATPTQDPYSFRGEDALITIAFGTVGVVLASRRPSHPIGWLFLAIALTSGITVLLQQYATYALLTRDGAMPGGAIAAWGFSLLPVLGMALGLAFVLLLFPDGRLPSPRWRAVGWLVSGASVVLVVGLAGEPGPIRDFPEAENPFGVQGAAGALFTPLADAGFILFVVGIALCLGSVIVRFRSSEGVLRAQLKWFLFAGGFLTLAFMLGGGFEVLGGGLGQMPRAFSALLPVGICAVPVATGVAILKYRLYDIDRIISRTVAYAIVVGILGAGYLGLVVGLQQLTRHPTGGGDLAVAASTLVVVVAFRPLSRRIRGAVERRFNRTRYDAARTIENFAARLRDEIDLDALRAELKDVVRETMQPEHVALWLREAPAQVTAACDQRVHPP